MKMANGTGSIYKMKGNRRKPWCVRITTGYKNDFDLERSVQIRKVLGTYSSRKEAMQALARFLDNPYDLNADKITFRQVYEDAKEEFSASRMHNYRSAFRYLEPIADQPIRSIKAAQMQKCIDACQTTQQREIKTVCRKVFAYALKQEIIDRNPALYLDSNTVEATIVREILTTEQITDLWSIDEWWAKVTLMLLYSGMRTKELQDLSPEDIDIENMVINIGKAKNKSSVRVIPIHDRVGGLWSDWKEHGRTFSYNALNKRLKSKYGRTPHDCRHTFTTKMRECGCELLPLQLLLGHTPKTITEKIYTHITIDELRKSINLLHYE